ncbi:TIGR02206 family membrane protein [Bacillus luteolus]|uniref:TIGR02206 family membrane protein n=1 Tax=Litchfieldia luteola TaxID=682179 RepID=A0ABR9QIA9_9BACI|nr:TIGR02206 family membrane protein [Cytobacillus luteolus]MBE4908214.1 TIGR02206 family membrane protein [Cytobacillus luteolus]MBP1943000.1 putative integral membrane protein (TIGR02206 family) [Cytobacillus luteolus]
MWGGSIIEHFFGRTNQGEPFQFLSGSHLIMVGLLVFLAFLLYFYREQIRGTVWGQSVRILLILILVLSEVTLTIWYNYTGVWDAVDTLPFQLCSISLILSVFMLVTRNYLLFEVTYFLGVGGALQAMLTPELFYDFPHYRYFHFFLAHIAIIVASFYMIWIEKYIPTLKSVLKAFLAINIIAVFVFTINKITGGNYMFLAHKPSNPSLIDLLGPYPWYILSLEFVALAMFFILYIPFALINKKNRQ